MTILNNILIMTDSYKFTHWRQYPVDTTKVFSFFESRGGQDPWVVFFGLQYFIKKYLTGVVVTEQKIAQAKRLVAAHLGDDSFFNEEGWRYILSEYGGKLPVEIRAVPEGTVVPVSNVMMTIVNTDDSGKTAWLANHLETLLSQVWYTSTVATQSRAMKQTIMRYLQETGDADGLPFKLHDFGYRGSTSPESAALGGAAHLVNFMGTDTVAALEMAMEYYGADMPGFSVPATEHSTMTSWGKGGELDAYRNVLRQYPTGIVSVVSDSFDIFKACRDYWGGELKDAVLQRDGVLVVRPDSGDPVIVLKEVFAILGEAFGTTLNEKGYKLLPPQVRVIQGDGIDRYSLQEILEALKLDGWSADNIVFGSGGGLLQKVNRDTQKFAIKCSAVKRGGEWQDVMKDPITDPGKRSKAGRITLVQDDEGDYHTVQLSEVNVPGYDVMRTVYRNGELLREQTFDDVRQRAEL